MRYAVAAAALMALLGAACGGAKDGFTLGPEAQVDVSPSAVSFGDIPRGEVARRIITVRHVGTSGVIRLDPVRLETTSPDLALTLVEKTELLPGEAARLQITYTSAHDEPDEGVLVIGHNLEGHLETRIPVSAPGQRARLVASPGVLDFGVVQAGAPRTLELAVLNGGTAPAVLTGYHVDGDAGDFAVAFTPNASVPVGEHATVSVTYAPSGRDADTATLTLETERSDVSLTVTMYGEEETPVLVTEPSLVQLGWTRPFETTSREVALRNDGNADLEIDAIGLFGAPASLHLTGVPSGPFTLRPTEAVVVGLIFQPTAEHPMTSAPLGTLGITSNDEARNPHNVPIYGAAGLPAIVVVPEDVVDFAYVAEGFTATRSVVVYNQGDGAVTVTAAALVDPTSDEFAFPDTGLLPHTLQPGETLALTLTFENRDGAEGTVYARFALHTTDPVVPEYPLDVVARRAQRPTCEAAFVPDLLAFGAFRPGAAGEATMHLVNYGSGNCEYREADLVGCLQVGSGAQFYFECDDQIAFNPFTLVDPPAAGEVLGPGGALALKLRFDAPAVQPGHYGRDSYYGRIALILQDPNANRFAYVAPEGGWGRGVNLRAEVAVPLISVTPPRLGFGLVRTDCQSDTRLVRVAATGPMDATVSAITSPDCGADLIVDAPPLPAVVPGFGSLYLPVRLAPGVPGGVQCTLEIANDSDNLPLAKVDIDGAGTDAAHQIDRFAQVPPPKVDVLFVVDDSFSMADDQQRLREELPAVVDIATAWGQDYHLAVTTTDTLLVRGQFKGVPRFATPSDPLSTFADNLVVGTSGFYIERGLEAAYLALYNRSVRSDIACLNLPNQCPADDGEGLPLVCLEGYCSGRNWGFLRDDAELVVIIVSDEEDGSDHPVPYYVDALANLKAPNSGVGVTVHAIAVTQAGCPGGYGTPGYRYVQAVEAFGGHVSDICGDNFAAEFLEVGQRTFGLSDRFYPTLPPAPGTLSVRVNGTTCTTGWSWNASIGAVVFDEASPCFPQFNDQVDLEYDVYCAEPAP